MPVLHEDQAAALPKLLKLLGRGARLCAVSPTGSGKTVLGAAAILELLKKRKRLRVLWVAHRFELLDQAQRHLIEAGIPAEDVGLLTGDKKRNVKARVLVAGIGMFQARDVPKVDLIVVDEAHRVAADSYQRLVNEFPEVPVLGLTATPLRLDGKPMGATFDELLVVAGMTELIANKRIANPVTYGLPYEKAKALVAGIASQHGDYATSQLGKVMMRGKLMGDVVSETNRLAPGERTLVFAVNREHGKELAARFRKAGRPTAYLDGETPAGERAGILARLESGEVEVVVNIDVLTEGFDCPAVKCIVLARPTKSLTRFLQYCGRASRNYHGKRPIIVDNAGNCWRHGLPEQEREWSLEGREKGTGEPAVRHCKECGAMMPINATECPECGAAQPVHERELEEQRAELERLKAREDDLRRRREVLGKLAAMKGLDAQWVESAMQEAV
jgi:DNA repair protein RadD